MLAEDTGVPSGARTRPVRVRVPAARSGVDLEVLALAMIPEDDASDAGASVALVDGAATIATAIARVSEILDITFSDTGSIMRSLFVSKIFW